MENKIVTIIKELKINFLIILENLFKPSYNLFNYILP